MSIIDLSKGSPPVDHLLAMVRRGDKCFYCFQPLTTRAIHWAGWDADVVMHPTCTVELTIRLLRDVWELECTSNTYITARTTPELRQRLLAEESR